MVAWRDLRRVLARALRSRRAELWFSARAWLLAPAVQGALRTLGVRRTLRAISVVRRPSFLGRRSRGSLDLAEGARCVDRAYAVHAVRGECLPRASVQHLLHRIDGTPSSLVIGVRVNQAPRPGNDLGMEAHAWVAPPDSPIGLDGFAVMMVLDDRGIRPASL